MSPHVSLSNISFSYPTFDAVGRSLKVAAFRQMTGGRVGSARGYVEVHALRDVSMEISSGERLGLIGHNGAGKSTLLRVISRLAHPQAGRVDISGKIVSLIEKGMGINPDLTGLENIELPLRLLGASTRQIRLAQEEIPEWTGLGPFINLPFRTYSEGMKARLSFALCTAIEGDILVLDEWIGAGDAAFVSQAQARLTKYLERTEIVVLSSHSLDLIKQTCTVAAWMERGSVIAMGDPNVVIDMYMRSAGSRAAVAAE